MILNAEQIVSKNIVHPVSNEGQRTTTYDATVGEIIYRGKCKKGSSFTLASRGVVWVVSQEVFSMPDNVTGVAALRTTWAHNGVFALNVGVIDPGWKGPLATAIVNFGRDDFVIEKGQPFFRIIFFEHDKSTLHPANSTVKERQNYINEICQRSNSFSKTFLNMSSLVKEVSNDVFGLPRWIQYLTRIGLIIAFLAILVPIAFSVWVDHNKTLVDVGLLEKRVTEIENDKSRLENSKTQSEINLNWNTNQKSD